MAHHGGGTWGRAEEARWCEEEGFLHERGCEGGEQLRFQPRVGFGQRNRGRFRPLFGHKPPFGHKLREAGGRARRDGLTSRTGRYFGAPVPRGSNQQVGGNMFKRRWDEPALMKEGGSSRGIGEMTQTKEEAKGGGESKKPGQIKVGDVVFPVNSEVKKGKNCVSEFDDDDDDLLEFDEEPRVIRDKKGDDQKGGARVKVCSRCTQKGHGVADCLGFQHIPHQPLQRNKKTTKKALVHVVGGALSVERLVTLLHKLCPTKWKWEPVPHGKDTFVVLFPSKGELQWAINFGGADVKEGGVATGVRAEFEEWFEEEEGFLLPKVLDVVIEDRCFELKFEVEKKGVDENGEEVEFNLEDWDGDEEDDVLEEVYERVEREEMEENEAGVQQEKIVQLANVGEVVVTPKRASERLMGSSGRHSLEKAKSKKAWMNLDPLSGRVVVSNLKT
ncbi:hypothetical protein OsJ_34012 [Oryza sativa Japonica Group]|uniref:DUF4283 domain-containing protein n=1 Tax=Oryza sativa subsp. japonica TaxID=39947 RepID=A3CBM3_ORYSJ|nr:hypothetical protein OsJ_34012 [Oryza sativa Japonica Group]